MVFNATLNNISFISWGQVYWWRKPEYPQKTTNLLQVMDKLYHIMYVCIIKKTRGSPDHELVTCTSLYLKITIVHFIMVFDQGPAPNNAFTAKILVDCGLK
jgi:hypothetical protein